MVGTDTLTGSVATMHKSVLKFLKSARCSRVEALEAASLHPAQALGLDQKKGTLAFGADADLIILDRANLALLSTWIGKIFVQIIGCEDFPDSQAGSSFVRGMGILQKIHLLNLTFDIF